MPSASEVQAATAAFRVSARTVYRWVRAGVDIRCPEAVARHLASMASPSPKALDAIIEQLRTRTQS